MLAFVAGLSMLALVTVGVGPAFTATRVQLADPLKLASAGETASRRELRASRVLVVAEVAAAFVLFVGAVLMLESFRVLQRVDFGIAADRVITATPWLSQESYDTPLERSTYFTLAVERLSRLANVRAVAIRADLDSLRGAPWLTDSVVDRAALIVGTGNDETRRTRRWDVRRYVVTPSYFAGVALPLKRGRVLSERDRDGGERVAVISERVAAQFWPNADPVGRQFRFGASAQSITVVGVVGDVQLLVGGPRGTSTRRETAVYLPAAQATGRNEQILVQTDQPAVLIPMIRRTLSAIDPDQSVGRVEQMSEQLGAGADATLWIGAAFATLATGALVLASIGLYGVIAHSVTRRTREIGVRMALGADARTLRRLVVGQAVRLTTIGLGIGAIGAWGLTRLIGTMVQGTTASGLVVYAAVGLLFLVVGAAASAIPARRAVRIDPLVALRTH